MKVATQKPKAVKSPVFVTETKYEMWYCKPINLGTIDKRGVYWYTTDGMRFVSSRNALDYLIRLHDLGTEPGKLEQIPEQQRKKIAAEVRPVVAKPETAHVTKKKVEIDTSGYVDLKEYLEVQNNPLFQDFLKFIRTKKRALSPDRSSASAEGDHTNR